MDICETKTWDEASIVRHPWELARLKVVQDMIRPYYNDKQKIKMLDIGCGDVYVAQQLSLVFPAAYFYCVDSAFTEGIKSNLEKRNKNYPISLYATLEEVKAKHDKENFDIILLLDVIEHIEDDISFMKGLNDAGFINNETKVIITVPAFQSLFSKHDVYLKHYRRYTSELLRKNMNRGGLKIVKGGYFFSLLLIPRIISKILDRYKKVEDEKGIGKYVSKGFVDKWIIAVMFGDYLFGKTLRAIGISLPGLSCFAVCQKPQ